MLTALYNLDTGHLYGLERLPGGEDDSVPVAVSVALVRKPLGWVCMLAWSDDGPSHWWRLYRFDGREIRPDLIFELRQASVSVHLFSRPQG